MNYRRWMIVSYMLLLMAFTISVLLIPGQKYQTLTTSDSGWEYDVAVEIDKNSALTKNNPLSHAPYGLHVPPDIQLQPLITVMLYRGISAINPSVTLMDIVKYYAPLVFALSLIPIFLMGRELGGDIGGIASAFFAATLISTIYWHKVGAFDREPIQLILGAWTMYLAVRMFKARGMERLKFGILVGMVYGLFGLSWTGYIYLAFVLLGGMLLMLFAERLRYLTLLLVVPLLLLVAAEFAQGQSILAQYGSVENIPYEAVIPIGEGLKYVPVILIAGLISAGIFELLHRVSIWSMLKDLFKSFRRNLSLILGVLAVFAVLTATLSALAGTSPIFWISSTQTALGHVGGGGELGTRYAGEMRSPKIWQEVTDGFYGMDILTFFIFALVLIALMRACWSNIKRIKEPGLLLMIPLVFVLMAMVWPGHPDQVGSQIRFTRLWWAFVPVLAGVGLATAISLARRFSLEPFVEWLKYFRDPIVLTLVVSIFAVGIPDPFSPSPGFVLNAYNEAYNTTPPTEWHGVSLYGAFMETFGWIRENTSENSIFSIQWSYGHFFTGAARRGALVDGCEEYGDEGVWENDPSFTPRPPDYIRDENGRVYGREIDRKPSEVNGRRIDVGLFPIIDEDGFELLLASYRDNYGTKIDYVIFSYDEYATAVNYYQFTQPVNILLGAERIRQPVGLQPITEGQNHVFNLGENREEVVLDPQTGNVYLRTDEGNLNMDGYGVLSVDKEYWEKGYIRVSSYDGFAQPSSTPDIQETLLIFLNEANKSDIVSAWLIEGVSAEIAGIPIPVSVDVWANNAGGIDYAKIVFTSSNNYVKVIEINHVPSPTSPADGASINDNTPEFRWSSAVGASRYELWVDSDVNMSSPEIQEDNLTDTTYTSALTLSDGDYFWRVAAYNSANSLLGWSETSVFTIDTQAPGQPQLSEPEDNAELSTLNVTFSWIEPESGVTYEFQIDEENGFTEPLHDNTGLTDTSYTYTFPMNGVYYWRVRARDAAGNASEWSSIFTLTIRAPPQAPTLSSPENGVYASNNTPTLEWAGGNGDNYRLLVSTSSDLSSPTVDLILVSSVTSYAIAEENALMDGTYYWKVVAVVGADENSSDVWTLTVDTVSPEEPVLYAPENVTETGDNTPTFEWSLSPGADNYHLIVDSDIEFGSPDIDVLVVENTYTLTTELSPGNYYWKVTAKDAAGNENASSIWTFGVTSSGG